MRQPGWERQQTVPVHILCRRRGFPLSLVAIFSRSCSLFPLGRGGPTLGGLTTLGPLGPWGPVVDLSSLGRFIFPVFVRDGSAPYAVLICHWLFCFAPGHWFQFRSLCSDFPRSSLRWCLWSGLLAFAPVGSVPSAPDRWRGPGVGSGTVCSGGALRSQSVPGAEFLVRASGTGSYVPVNPYLPSGLVNFFLP